MFLRERIPAPLAMKDTDFSVPGANLGAWPSVTKTGRRPRHSASMTLAAGEPVEQPAEVPLRAGRLVSTVNDYLAFGQMMLRCGKYEHGRVLSRPSVELMTADQLTPGQKSNSGAFAGYFGDHGWELGLSLATRRDEIGEPVGRYGRNGGLRRPGTRTRARIWSPY